MNTSRIASRYARALFTLARDKGSLEPVRTDLARLARLLDESEEFASLLESPVIKDSEKARLVGRLLTGRVEPVTLDFMKMLVDHKRETYLASIFRMFMELYKAEQGFMEAHVESAVPLEASLLEDLKSRLEKSSGCRIDFMMSVDPELIGGFRLTLEDQQMDASVAAQLKRIKQELRESKT